MATHTFAIIRRRFMLIAFVIMTMHLTLVYVFIRQQIVATRSLTYQAEPFYDNTFFLDEQSPLVAYTGNTDWGNDQIKPKIENKLFITNNKHHEGNSRVDDRKGPRASNTSRSSSYKGSDTGPGSKVGGDSKFGNNTGTNSNACFGLKLQEEDFDEPLTWQDVVPGYAAVFSAYLDTAPNSGYQPNRLVVIGMAGPHVLTDMRFVCQIWYRNPEEKIHSWIVNATSAWLETGSENRGGDVFFYCPANPTHDPLAVSIINRQRCAHSPPNILLIRNIDESQARTRPVNDFAVCIPPLRNKFNDSSALVETIELNFILGANRIVLYDQNSTSRVRDFYNSYKHEDTATIIPWKPPHIKLLHGRASNNKAVLSALNDCLYRFRYSSRYIVFTDIEEFILSKVTSNWKHLMVKLNKEPGQTAVFGFRRALFEFPAKRQKQQVLGKQVRLRSQQKKFRIQDMAVHLKPRYIVVPTYVDIVGIYYAISTRKGGTLEVREEDALVHDYNNQDEKLFGHTVGRLKDTCAQVYQNELLSRVIKRNSLVRGIRIN